MKKSGSYSGIGLLILWLFSSPPLSFAEEPKAPSSTPQTAEKNFSQTFKEKYQEEMEAVKKDTAEAGEEIKKSFKELPEKSGEEFQETGTALKDAGKEMKEGAAESWQDLKNLFKKK